MWTQTFDARSTVFFNLPDDSWVQTERGVDVGDWRPCLNEKDSEPFRQSLSVGVPWRAQDEVWLVSSPSIVVAGALAAAGISIALIKTNNTSEPPAAAAPDGDANRPADSAPAQIEQVPRPRQDVFIPPSNAAVSASPAAAPAVK